MTYMLAVIVNEPLSHRSLALLAQLRAQQGDRDAAVDAWITAVPRAHAEGDRQGLSTVLARGTFVLHAIGRDDAAAVLAGVVNGGLLAGLQAIPRQEEPGLEAVLAEVAGALGPDAYEASIKKGASLSYNEIVAFALDAVH